MTDHVMHNPIRKILGLNMLLKLHKKNLITTEEYNKAVILFMKKLVEIEKDKTTT